MRSYKFLQIILGFGYDLDIFSSVILNNKLIISLNLLIIKIFKNFQEGSLFPSYFIHDLNLQQNSWRHTNLAIIMGNFIKQHLTKNRTFSETEMNRPFNKNVPNRQNTQVPINKNNTQRMVSQPKSNKNINDNINTTKTADVKVISNEEIISKTLSLAIQHQDYQSCWVRFLEIVKNILKFNLIFPVPLCHQGEQLLKNGSFIVNWLRIISKNPYVNMNMILKNVKEHYFHKITQQRQKMQSYLNQYEKPEQKKTPIKIINNNLSLKRSKPRGSQKKVRFGKDQIIYPMLQSYVSINKENKPTKQQRKLQIRKRAGFILDYLQINDIFFLQDVSIIAVIRQFDSTYSIMQVREKSTSKQHTCIGIITSKSVGDHSLPVIQQVEKLYENLCFLELEGKDPNSLWINSLPSDIQ